MSINPFNTSNNNPFQTSNNNPFLTNNNNQLNNINSIFNNNITNKNVNQIQSSENKINIFQNNQEISTSIKNNEINKKDDNKSLNSISFSNNNIFSNLNNNNININKEEKKDNLTIDTNSNIKTNNNTNNIGFNFFNINEKKDKPLEATTINNKTEEKKESNNIFLAQSNNILNKMNNDIDINKNKENKDINNKSKSLIEDFSIKQNKNNDKDREVKEFLNNLLIEDNLILANKEMMEYEKKQLFAKLGGEIIDELRTTLNSNKEEFKQYVNNTRMLEEKFYQTNKIINNNIENSVQKEMKYNNILLNLNKVYQNAHDLDTKISNRNKIISDALDYIKNNNNNTYINNLNYIKVVDFEENNAIFKDLKEISKKVSKIDDDLNIISNIMDKNENNSAQLFTEKDNKKKGNINGIYTFNNNMEGVWIKRNNENKIYVEEKEINGLFNDCYNGLNGLILETEQFNEIYNKLKNKLINKMNKNNNIDNNKEKVNSNNNILNTIFKNEKKKS